MIRLASALCVSTLTLTLTLAAHADVLPAPAPPLANANGDEAWARTSVGKPTSFTISVETSPGTPIRFFAIRLPEGATLTPEPHPSPRARIEWTPTEDDLGTFDAIVEATDGRTRVQKTIRFTVSDDWADAFLPAAGTSIYFPRNGAEWGAVYGVPLQFVLVAWISRNTRSGASHGRIDLQVEPVIASKGEPKFGADVSLGFDASFERMPKRRFLIPGYGARLGDFVHGAAPGGSFWHFTPELALYLWADHGVFVTTTAGWVLPLGSGTAGMGGPRASLGITLSL